MHWLNCDAGGRIPGTTSCRAGDHSSHGIGRDSSSFLSWRSIMRLRRFATACVAVALCSATAFAQEPAPLLTQDGGQPVGDNQNSRTAGPDGSVLLDNFHLIQK